MQATRSSAASSVKWSVVEYGGLALISFSSLVVYARFLSASEFGLFSIALSVIELMTVLVGMLFHDALVQRRDLRELHYDTAFTVTLALSAVIVALCWGSARAVARWAEVPDAGPVLMWLSVSLPLTAANASVVARRRRELDFRTLAVSSLVGRTGGAAAGIALVVLGFGIWALVAQQVLFVLLSSLVLWARCGDLPRLRFGAREFRELIGFGLACVSDLMLLFTVKRLFTVVSGVMLGAYGAGLLNLAFRAVDTLWSIAASAVSQITLPLLSSLQADERRFRRAFHGALALMCLVSYFGFILLGATAPEVVVFLFGAQWLELSPYVTLLSLLVLTGAVRIPVSSVLKALGRPRDLMLCQVGELGFVVTAIALTGVPSVGWATGIWLAREAFGSAIQVWMFRRATRMALRELLSGARVPLVAALAMFAAVSACRQFLTHELGALAALAVLVPVGAAVYFGWVALLERALLVDLIRFIHSAFRRVQPAAT
jgi:O-antigen/teichoic acid export membrane protein